jgi:hypothetical protein
MHEDAPESIEDITAKDDKVKAATKHCDVHAEEEFVVGDGRVDEVLEFVVKRRHDHLQALCQT